MPATLSEILVPVCASLGGALAAGLASYWAGRGMRLHEWKLGMARERLLERQRLYAKFVAEYDRNLLITGSTGEKSADNVIPLFALFAEISLVSSEPVQLCAKRICDLALSANSAEVEGKNVGYYPAKAAFLTAARDELAMLEAAVVRSTP